MVYEITRNGGVAITGLTNSDFAKRDWDGKDSKYGPSIGLIIDEELADILFELGWTKVVEWEPRSADDRNVSVEGRQYIIWMTIRYDNYPPDIVYVSSRGDTIEITKAADLDILKQSTMDTCDIMIRQSGNTVYINELTYYGWVSPIHSRRQEQINKRKRNFVNVAEDDEVPFA